MTNKALTPRQVRWANFLSQFNFTVKYQPGKLNRKADYLSCLPGDKTEGGGKNLNFRLQRILKDENLDPELQEIARNLNNLAAANSTAKFELNALMVAVDDMDPLTLQDLMDQGYQEDPEPVRILEALESNER